MCQALCFSAVGRDRIVFMQLQQTLPDQPFAPLHCKSMPSTAVEQLQPEHLQQCPDILDIRQNRSPRHIKDLLQAFDRNPVFCTQDDACH